MPTISAMVQQPFGSCTLTVALEKGPCWHSSGYSRNDRKNWEVLSQDLSRELCLVTLTRHLCCVVSVMKMEGGLESDIPGKDSLLEMNDLLQQLTYVESYLVVLFLTEDS